MSDAENAFAHATDKLIGLYRSVERRTFDLPLVSIWPFLISLWATVSFVFFFYLGLLLIIPVNFVVLVRNLFPGRWRYRPFFLRHLYYVWLWIWRGEAATFPFIFVRPLMNVFMKGHFERRLRRLRLEILFRDELSDATRSALLGRLDAALERWKTPRFATFFFSLLLPGLASFVSLYKESMDFLGSLGIHIPTDNIMNFVSQNMSEFGVRLVGASALVYVLTIPVTAFLAKRGLFLGGDVGRICFPGEQKGSGAYSEEKEILASVGLRARETPIDFWLIGFTYVVTLLFQLLNWSDTVAWMRSSFSGQPLYWDPETQLLIQVVGQTIIFIGVFLVAVLRRGRIGRA